MEVFLQQFHRHEALFGSSSPEQLIADGEALIKLGEERADE
jgi:hypothetical protein